MKTKICTKCNIEKSLDNYYKIKNNRLSSRCKECRKIYLRNYLKGKNILVNIKQRARAFNIKIKVLTYYSKGNLCCNCCGENELLFLTLDHIDGGGTKHRKEIGGGDKIYEKLYRENYPIGYQVLCFNCNWGRHRNKGVCPHKSELLHIFKGVN